MKTKFIYKIAVLIIMVTAFAGCKKDFLVEVPRLSQSNELSLSSYVGLKNATVGAYSLLCSPNWYGAGFVITADLKGGNAKRGPLNSGRYVNEYLWNNNASATSGLWDDAYSTIARANNIINTINGGFSEIGVTKAQLSQLKGECFFLRALSHWDLVRMYAQPYIGGIGNPGVPVVLVTENGYPKRNTVGEVYTRIVTDLDSARTYLSVTNPRGTDRAWATTWAARALLAKVYLYMGQWQNAANMATDVIANGGFTLFTTAKYTTWDKGGYWGSGGAGSEIIFQVDGSQLNTDSGFWEAISYMVSPSGYGDIATSNDLLSLYEAGDVRAALFVNPASIPGDDYWTLKYPGRLGVTPPLDFNTPILRLSEMYLIRAEALLNGATRAGVTALSDYNAIRTQRGLTAAAVAPTLADIYKERRRELCFEGNELFDLSRTQRSLARVDFSGSLNKNVPYVLGGTPLQNYLWAMPIPQAEVDANINMAQNPQY